jgi:hypothetical protein
VAVPVKAGMHVIGSFDSRLRFEGRIRRPDKRR